MYKLHFKKISCNHKDINTLYKVSYNYNDSLYIINQKVEYYIF